MPRDLEIPKELQGTFKRVMSRIPPELRDDEEIQQKVLVFLKFGGEKLARQEIEITQKRFMEEIDIIKKRATEELPEDTHSEGLESDEEEDDNGDGGTGDLPKAS